MLLHRNDTMNWNYKENPMGSSQGYEGRGKGMNIEILQKTLTPGEE